MDTRDATPLRLPSSTLFPVVVTALLCSEEDQVARHTPILRFKYWNHVDEPVDEANGELPKKVEKEFHSTFEIPIEGELKQWNIIVGSEINDPNFIFATLVEPCSHSVQYAGLCALCGARLDEQDYTEFSNTDRAPIAMAHDSSGLTVSFDEAQRMEKLSSSQLLKSKKLILVVDLDQTVIHAAVDPTIGDWQSDPDNPNYDAVKDVKSFTLLEEGYMPGVNGQPPNPRQTIYYVKLRPGLEKFLDSMYNLYEMHVYTMATRAYAVEIAKIIDPEGKYFGDRILSRDESGNIHQKSLKRLFPVSTAMVAIIDDRGDVWKWSPNLIKVVPYNFFVGIGDINSNFLPQQNAVILPPDDEDHASREPPPGEPERSTTDDLVTITEETPEQERLDEESQEPTVSNEGSDREGTETSDREAEGQSALEFMRGADNDELLAVQSFERSQLIESQLLERPLARQQELIEQEDQDESQPTDDTNGTASTETSTPGSSNGHISTPPNEPRGLLHNGDVELEHLDHSLSVVHEEYYKDYEILLKKKGGISRIREEDLPDLGVIMPRMKRRVFNDCVILFSGILPLGTDLDRADIVQWVRSFGAIVVAELIDTVTHVIARKNGTQKVRKAFGNPNIKVVQLSWLFDSIANWKRVPEEGHLLEKPEGGDEAMNAILAEDESKSSNQEEDNMEFVDTDSFVMSLNDGNIDWNEINKELDEFMNSTDEEEDGNKSGSGSGSDNDSSDSGSNDSDADSDDDSDDDDDSMNESEDAADEKKGQTGRKTVGDKRPPDQSTEDDSRKRSRSPNEDQGSSAENSKKLRVGDNNDGNKENNNDDDDDDDDDDFDDFAAELENDLR